MMVLMAICIILTVVLFVLFASLIAEQECEHLIINEQEKILQEYEELILKMEEGEEK
jgi:hypothetical protein